jgi:hypothetical protein
MILRVLTVFVGIVSTALNCYIYLKLTQTDFSIIILRFITYLNLGSKNRSQYHKNLSSSLLLLNIKYLINNVKDKGIYETL